MGKICFQKLFHLYSYGILILELDLSSKHKDQSFLCSGVDLKSETYALLQIHFKLVLQKKHKKLKLNVLQVKCDIIMAQPGRGDLSVLPLEVSNSSF